MDKTLCKPDTYERPESEVLELITAERARVKKPNGMYPLHYAAHYSKSTVQSRTRPTRPSAEARTVARRASRRSAGG